MSDKIEFFRNKNNGEDYFFVTNTGNDWNFKDVLEKILKVKNIDLNKVTEREIEKIKEDLSVFGFTFTNSSKSIKV